MTVLPSAISAGDIRQVVSSARPSRVPRPSTIDDNSNPQQGTGMTPNLSPPNPEAAMGSPMNAPLARTYATKIPPTHKDARKLFVGGLPADVTEQEFREFFEQFGAVMDSVVMFDRETHRSRGFGFVTFEDPGVCQRLLEMNDAGEGVGRLVMRGKTCEVKAAQPKDGSMRGMGKYNNNRQMHSSGRTRGVATNFPGKPYHSHNVLPPGIVPSADPTMNATGPLIGPHASMYIPDPNLHPSLMYSSGSVPHYVDGSVYYPHGGMSTYLPPMYYPGTSDAPVAMFDPYAGGTHRLDMTDSMGASHVINHHHAVSPPNNMPQPSAYAPAAIPPYLVHHHQQHHQQQPAPHSESFVVYPPSVMQPLAPGLPVRQDVPSSQVPANPSHHPTNVNDRE